MCILKSLAAVCVVIAVIVGACWLWHPFDRPVALSPGPTVQNLEKMGHLVSLKVNVSDHLHKKWDWWLDTIQVLYLARGDALIACDLRGARIVRSDQQAKTATILLPAPTVVQPRVNLGNSGIVWSSKPWVRPGSDFDTLLTEVQKEAQTQIEQAAGCPENLQVARSATRNILTEFWSMLGWSVEVVFDDEQKDRR